MRKIIVLALILLLFTVGNIPVNAVETPTGVTFIYINGSNNLAYKNRLKFKVAFEEDVKKLHPQIKKRFEEDETINKIFEYPNFIDEEVRVEKGAVIREGVKLGKGVVVLMNATINVNAEIKEYTMIDMNVVVGSNAIIGANVHIGAGSVISGVLEPVSSKPVIIEDNVFIGAGSVILPGIKVGKGAIVGAGSVVTKDVLSDTVVYGNPARPIKDVNESLKDKVKNNPNLR